AITSLARIDQLRNNVPFPVQLNIGLGNDVLVFFPGGEIKGIRFIISGSFLLSPNGLVFVLHDGLFEMFANFEIGIPSIIDGHVVNHLAILNLSVRAFDKSEFIDSGITTKRRNQTDVRALRSFNGANAPIVSCMQVTNLKPGPFTTQPTGPQG